MTDQTPIQTSLAVNQPVNDYVTTIEIDGFPWIINGTEFVTGPGVAHIADCGSIVGFEWETAGYWPVTGNPKDFTGLAARDLALQVAKAMGGQIREALSEWAESIREGRGEYEPELAEFF